MGRTRSISAGVIGLSRIESQRLAAELQCIARHAREVFVASRQRAQTRVLDLLVAPKLRDARSLPREALLRARLDRVDVQQRAEDVEQDGGRSHGFALRAMAH